MGPDSNSADFYWQHASQTTRDRGIHVVQGHIATQPTLLLVACNGGSRAPHSTPEPTALHDLSPYMPHKRVLRYRQALDAPLDP